MHVPSLVDGRFRVRQFSCLQNDSSNERMTENDHITSALLTEISIVALRGLEQNHTQLKSRYI